MDKKSDTSTSSFSRSLNGIWRELVFFFGDVRHLPAFPWVTWAKHVHYVELGEVVEALPLIKFGDVGIHRDWGYLSNLAIPGFMKHAWIHTIDGTSTPTIVEAISEGVVKRSAIYPMYSDYTIILTPRDEEAVKEEHRKGACKKASQIVGVKYDADFKFDIEQEVEFYKSKQKEEARADLGAGEAQIQHYDHGFSCTELVSYAWWHRREELSIYRTRSRGKSVILADSFLNRDWKIRWMSKSVTPDAAHKHGLHEQGLSLIEEYRK